MDIRLLGPIEVFLDGRALDLDSPKQKALLAALALAAPAVVSTDRLLDDLWGEHAGDRHNALWIHVSRLRAALRGDGGADADAVLVTHGHGYALAIDPATVDVNRFEDDVRGGLALVEEDPDRAAELLDRALSTWRGPPLADVAYEEFAQPAIRHLTELRAAAVDGRLDAAHRLGRAHELLDLVEEVRAARPLDERFVRHHVLALVEVGRVTDALRTLRRFRDRLAAELGVGPSPSLRRLEAQLRHGQLELAVAVPPAGPGRRTPKDQRPDRPPDPAPDPDPETLPGPDTGGRSGRERGERRLRPWMPVAGALVVLLTVLAATGHVALLRGEPPRIGVVLVSADGVHRRQLDEGLAQASREFDIEIETLAPVTDVDDQVRRYLATGPDFVVLDSSIETEDGVALQPIVDDHPDVRFTVATTTGDAPPLVGDNVAVVTYAHDEGGFLAGAVAALESRTGVVGFVGASPSAVDDVRAGFEAGALAVDPSVRVLSTHLVAAPFDVWVSPAAAQEAATRLYDAGADVVMQVAGASGRGVLAAAVDGSVRLDRHLWVIGSDVDEWLLADTGDRDHVLTSVVERHDLGIVRAVERFIAGDHDDVLMGVADGGLAVSTAGDHLSASTLDRLVALADRLASGDVTVPSMPATPPTAPPPGVVVRVEATVDGCAARGLPARVAPEDTVTVTLDNRTTRAVDLELWPVVGGTTPPTSGAPADLVPLSTPWSSATAPPGGSNAITVRLGPASLTTGRWSLWCVDTTSHRGTRTPVFEVADGP